MNKVYVRLAEVSELTGEVVGVHEVVIDSDEYDQTNVLDFFTEHMEDIRKDAAKAVASRFVDYYSFGSDSDYLDRLDRIADTYYLKDMRVPGAETFSYDVEGIYAPHDDAPELWKGVESASCVSEARFRGLWTMAINSGYSLEDLVRHEYSPAGAIGALQACMDALEVTELCDLSRPDSAEVAELLGDLLEFARNGSDLELKAAVLLRVSDLHARLTEERVDAIVELPAETTDVVLAR